MVSARGLQVSGFLFAIGSAGTFALSGIFASALMSAGWTPGAAVTTRIGFSAILLLVPTLLMLRGRWVNVRRAWGQVLLFGLLGVAACQFAFFLAVRYIPPSLALLIEFTGPVLLIFWTWARTRVAPSALTLLGAAIALCGLVAISGAIGNGGLHPLGVFFGLIAAIGNASYFALGARANHGIPPLPFTGLGLGVAALLLLGASVTGLLPFEVTSAPTLLSDVEVPWWVAVAGLVLISTVFAYLFGVTAARRLGATVSSFAAYSEPMFGILWTILLLSIVPTGMQWLGAALIVIGVVTVKIGELRRTHTRSSM